VIQGSFYVHRLPYDSFATIPVISGFPLRLASNGSIVVNIEASSKAEIKSVSKMVRQEGQTVSAPLIENQRKASTSGLS